MRSYDLIFLAATFALLVTAIPAGAAMDADTILVEAEGFSELGGWSVDQQYMDQMGSPVLIAHGMGVPVADASTTITVVTPGRYRIWVRTWDWVSPWRAPGAPGRFKLLVDGRELETTFGATGARWHWQPGGSVTFERGETRVALHDLAGFDGRCDCIVLSRRTGFRPPAGNAALRKWRRNMLGLPATPPDAGSFDLVVVGGGIAGACAALSAARLGLTVALIQDRPVLGGNNSSEVRVHLCGRISLSPYPRLGAAVKEIDPNHHGNAMPARYYDDEKKLRVVRAQDGLKLFLNMHADQVERRGGRIVAVVATHTRTGERLRFPAEHFVDCTGDGTIGALAGAEFRMGREGKGETGEGYAPRAADKMTMGTSVMWYATKTHEAQTFPECPWAVRFEDRTAQRTTKGDWNWETGMDRDQVAEFERIRDYGLRVIYGNWSFLKNHAQDRNKYANYKLGWVAYIGGKRESRRLLGDVILTQQDIEGQRAFPDACVTTTWSIDLHYPDKKNQKDFPEGAFRSYAHHGRKKPYPIPYRCFYSRNVPNLFMAGRNISVTHVALGTVRVMRTTGMMGEVVGMAASLCKTHGCDPRRVYLDYLDELVELMRRGVPAPDGSTASPASPPAAPPEWLASAGRGHGPAARVTVSSTHPSGRYPARGLNDGDADTSDNGGRWLTAAGPRHVATFEWDDARRVNAARVVSGYNQGGAIVDPVTDFVLQYRDGDTWRDVPGARVQGNTATDWAARFDPVEANAVRLVITNTPSGVARVWEVGLYDVR